VMLHKEWVEMAGHARGRGPFNFETTSSLVSAYAHAAFGGQSPDGDDAVNDTGMTTPPVLTTQSYKHLGNRINAFKQCMPLLACLHRNWTAKEKSKELQIKYCNMLILIAQLYETQTTSAEGEPPKDAGSALPKLIADAASGERFDCKKAMGITKSLRLIQQAQGYRPTLFLNLEAALDSADAIKRLVPGPLYVPVPRVAERVSTPPPPPSAAAQTAGPAGALPLQTRPDDVSPDFPSHSELAPALSRKRDATIAFDRPTEDFSPAITLNMGASVPLAWNDADTDVLPPLDFLDDFAPLD
jgi:hypothetical protein